MLKGYKNKYLFIDLTTQKYETGVPSQAHLEEFIGGKALGLKILLEKGLITHDPYSAENPLIFITGPFTGSLIQTSARSALVTKSPLTNTFLDTHVGGHFGPMFKRAGYDYIYITGKSKKPVYLYIDEKSVRFEDASPLWGKGIFDTEKTLTSKYPDAKIASIGPAGENKVRYACIGTDLYRQFGRGGAGAVMGSKNLKALVVQGSQPFEYLDKDGFMELNKKLTQDIMEHPNRNRRYDVGTMMWIRMCQEEGKFLPTRNFQDVTFKDYEKITAETMKKELKWKSVGCFNCVIKCAKLAAWDNYELEGPEYETTAFLGSGCLINDSKKVAYANYLCDDLGLDTISAGVVASFAMEAYEKGLISSQDANGLDLKFGNSGALFSLLNDIAHRKGKAADMLAEGTRIASQKIGKGSDYFAVQIAGMELSGVNIKGCASMALGLATADFASHTRVWSATAEMKGQLNYENTPDWIIKAQDEVSMRNSLIVCDFLPFGFDRLLPILEKVCGLKYSEKEIFDLGDKIAALTRMYNLKNGRTRKDDAPPQRFIKEKHLSGIFANDFLTQEKFDHWLDVYFEKRGWDKEGVPTAQKIKNLGINRL